VSLYSISADNGIAFIVIPIAPSILIRSARLFSLACALHTARACHPGKEGWKGFGGDLGSFHSARGDRSRYSAVSLNASERSSVSRVLPWMMRGARCDRRRDNNIRACNLPGVLIDRYRRECRVPFKELASYRSRHAQFGRVCERSVNRAPEALPALAAASRQRSRSIT